MKCPFCKKEIKHMKKHLVNMHNEWAKKVGMIYPDDTGCRTVEGGYTKKEIEKEGLKW